MAEKPLKKINAIDALIALIIIAVIAFFAIRAIENKNKGDDINNTVEITLSVSDNIAYVKNVTTGDELYLFDGTTPLGKVTGVAVSDDSESAIIKLSASFPHDAEVYTVDGELVARGLSYKIRTESFSATAECIGIVEKTVAVERE